MKIVRLTDVKPAPVEMEGVRGAYKQLLIGQRDGTPTMSLRIFTLEPGGYTPHHAHPFEHINYVLAGRGEILSAEGPRPLAAGDFVLVPPDERHQFRNAGDGPFAFVCLVPRAYE